MLLLFFLLLMIPLEASMSLNPDDVRRESEPIGQLASNSDDNVKARYEKIYALRERLHGKLLCLHKAVANRNEERDVKRSYANYAHQILQATSYKGVQGLCENIQYTLKRASWRIKLGNAQAVLSTLDTVAKQERDKRWFLEWREHHKICKKYMPSVDICKDIELCSTMLLQLMRFEKYSETCISSIE